MFLQPNSHVARSRWTVPILRAGMGLFLVVWGIDKLASMSTSQQIFSHFYGVSAGELLMRLAGFAEVVLGLLLIAGVFQRPIAWIVLLIHSTSTIASWRQILDPWGLLGIGSGGTHLFLSSIVIVAVSIVLVLEAGGDGGPADAARRTTRPAERIG